MRVALFYNAHVLFSYARSRAGRSLNLRLLALPLFSVLIGCGGSISQSPPNSVVPSITIQPTNQTVTPGQTAVFTVVASSTTPLSYQWQKGEANIDGATSPSYTTPPTTVSDSGSRFRVVVANSAGSATSTDATLTVASLVQGDGVRNVVEGCWRRASAFYATACFVFTSCSTRKIALRAQRSL